MSNIYFSQAQAPPRGKRRAYRKLLKETKKHGKRTKRKAIRDTVLRWTDGIVPYRFVSGHFRKFLLLPLNTRLTIGIQVGYDIFGSIRITEFVCTCSLFLDFHIMHLKISINSI